MQLKLIANVGIIIETISKKEYGMKNQ